MQDGMVAMIFATMVIDVGVGHGHPFDACLSHFHGISYILKMQANHLADSSSLNMVLC